GAIALGSFTFTMTAMPGTPQIQNLIPMTYFNTEPTAGFVMGIVGSIILLGGGYAYLVWREHKYKAKGEGFVEPEKKANESEVAVTEELPNALLSFLPLLTVILTLNVFKWDIVVALLAGIIMSMVTNPGKYQGFTKSVSN